MPLFLIERHIPGIGQVGYEQCKAIAQKSNSVLDGMQAEGMAVEWKQSYVAGDKIYCVYEADSENTVREHASRGSFPANLVIPISQVLTPATGR